MDLYFKYQELRIFGKNPRGVQEFFDDSVGLLSPILESNILRGGGEFS